MAILLFPTLSFCLQANAPVFMFSGFGLDDDTTMVNGLLKSRSLTITNFGTAPLNVSGVTISGTEFAFTSLFPAPVPATIPPNGTLGPFVVVFTPTGSGVRTGQIVVQDDAPGNPHTIPLQGFGVDVAPGDFAILAQNNIPVATSTAAGGTAIYPLVATGGPSTIALKCSGAPQGAACTVQPAITLAAASIGGSDSSEMFNVTVTTTGTPPPTALLRGPRGGLWWSLAFAVGIALVAGRKRGVRGALLALCATAMVASTVTCGGSNPSNTILATPAGSYTLTLTATGNNGTGVVHTVPITLNVRPSFTP
ncbi:MAG TPA: hypothetical protein VJW20_07215 [Candidatus Angelobacter sp.]|nr:hypothetical protein [Candidatus Angelobacter sp.]